MVKIFFYILILKSFCFVSHPSYASLLYKDNVIISDQKPFLEALNKAKGYVYAGSYKLQDRKLPDSTLLEAFEKTQKNGVPVTIMTEQYLTEEEKHEDPFNVCKGDSLKAYQNLKVKVVSSSKRFQSTHFKLFITQDFCIVGTTNFDKNFEENNTLTRDFALIIHDPLIVNELKEVFEKDAKGIEVSFPSYSLDHFKGSRLSWGPDQHQKHFAELFKSATKSIEIYQQAFQDEDIANQLIKAVKRGVTVRILMSQYPFGIKHGNKSEALQTLFAKEGGEIRLTGEPIEGKKLHIHAKAIIIDGESPENSIMYLGSANFYKPALTKDRQVGLITTDPRFILPVRETFQRDWQAHEKFTVRPIEKKELSD